MVRSIMHILLATVLCAAGCGAPASTGTISAAAFGDPLTAAKCDRAYRNDAFGFGITPPDGSMGPEVNADVVDSKTLFAATWTAPTNRAYRVTVVNIGTTTFQDAVGGVRNDAGHHGLSILDDRPVALESGRVGWMLKTGSPGGAITTSVYDTRRGYLFATDVDVSGITSAELDVVNHVLLSFCVDP